jgi:hypothetical protein
MGGKLTAIRLREYFRAAGNGLAAGQRSKTNDNLAPATSRPSSGHNVRMCPEKTIRRLKTYAGAQGYVYQYYFVGQRPAFASNPEAPATEFVFDVTSDRKLTYAVSVFLRERALSEWAAKHARPLTEAEQYAAAKLRLFRAFDETEDMKNTGRVLPIDGSLLEEMLSTLGVE